MPNNADKNFIIGLEYFSYNPKGHFWSDKSEVSFKNWAEGQPNDAGSRRKVYMNIEGFTTKKFSNKLKVTKACYLFLRPKMVHI